MVFAGVVRVFSTSKLQIVVGEENTFLIPLCRSLAIFELQMFFWGSHPFSCKPATGAFGVCAVCVVHLET